MILPTEELLIYWEREAPEFDGWRSAVRAVAESVALPISAFAINHEAGTARFVLPELLRAADAFADDEIDARRADREQAAHERMVSAQLRVM